MTPEQEYLNNLAAWQGIGGKKVNTGGTFPENYDFSQLNKFHSYNDVKQSAPYVNRLTADNSPENQPALHAVENAYDYNRRAARGKAEADDVANQIVANNSPYFNTSRQAEALPFQSAAQAALEQRAQGNSGVQPQLGALQLQDMAAQSYAVGHAHNPLAARIASQSPVFGQIVNDAAQKSLQEQLTAQAGLGEALNQARSQDIQLTQDKANLVSQYRAMGDSLDDAVIKAETTIRQREAEAAAARGARKGALTNSIIGAGGALAGGALAIFSDKRLKENIKPGDKDIEDFLDAISSKSFSYKNNPEQLLGIMAQDAEKSKVGKSVVSDTDMGKMLDLKKAMMAMLAASANMNKRIRKMES